MATLLFLKEEDYTHAHLSSVQTTFQLWFHIIFTEWKGRARLYTLNYQEFQAYQHHYILRWRCFFTSSFVINKKLLFKYCIQLPLADSWPTFLSAQCVRTEKVGKTANIQPNVSTNNWCFNAYWWIQTLNYYYCMGNHAYGLCICSTIHSTINMCCSWTTVPLQTFVREYSHLHTCLFVTQSTCMRCSF